MLKFSNYFDLEDRSKGLTWGGATGIRWGILVGIGVLDVVGFLAVVGILNVVAVAVPCRLFINFSL